MKHQICLRFHPIDLVRWRAMAALASYTLTRLIEVALEDYISRNTSSMAEIRQEIERGKIRL